MYERTIQPPTPQPKSANELLAEILAQPDDDAPRLVYADWLIQRGDPRGEFITVQCELARIGRDGGAAVPLQAREAELLAKHKKTWVGEFAGTRIEYGFEGGGDYVKGTPTKWHFQRGFVDGVEMQVPDFLRNAPALFSCEPLRWYHPTNGSVSQLLEECNVLHELRQLQMGPWKFRGTELRELAADTKLSALETLQLSGCRIGVKAMIDSPSTRSRSRRYARYRWRVIASATKGAAALANAKPITSKSSRRRCRTKLHIASSFRARVSSRLARGGTRCV